MKKVKEIKVFKHDGSEVWVNLEECELLKEGDPIITVHVPHYLLVPASPQAVPPAAPPAKAVPVQLNNVFEYHTNPNHGLYRETLVGYTASLKDSPDTMIDIHDDISHARKHALEIWPDGSFNLFKITQVVS